MRIPYVVSAALVALAIGVAGVPLAAQDFDKGLAAYRSGDFATALAEWRPLAEQGNWAAQFNLGFMHAKGQGFAKTMPWQPGGTNRLQSRAIRLRNMLLRKDTKVVRAFGKTTLRQPDGTGLLRSRVTQMRRSIWQCFTRPAMAFPST